MSDSSIHKSLAASSRMSKISKLTRSTKVLDDLKKSSVGEINALGDFMKQLVESRRAKKDAERAASASPRLSDSRATSASAIEQGETIVSVSSTMRREEEHPISDPLQCGNSRLAKIAVSYDFQSINSPLSGFEGAILNKKEFHSMLRQCLSVNLSKEELEAVFQKIDVSMFGDIYLRLFLCMWQYCEYNCISILVLVCSESEIHSSSHLGQRQ